jgi:hypothetical protein
MECLRAVREFVYAYSPAAWLERQHIKMTEDGMPEPRPDDRDVINRDLDEYRAFLQRGETRLSTIHRVAGAFLGSAGLLTLLPVLFRDAFVTLFSRVVFLENLGFPEQGSIERWLILVPITLSMVLPLWALYLLIRDLVEFYFTGHHFGGAQTGITYPRFILSGIRVSDYSLLSRDLIKDARRTPLVTELLVPASANARARLLREANLLDECKGLNEASHPVHLANRLQEFLFNYTASQIRTLAEEAAKMEAALARHHLLIRVLVLRYAKAFLLIILTTITTNEAPPQTDEMYVVGSTGAA